MEYGAQEARVNEEILGRAAPREVRAYLERQRVARNQTRGEKRTERGEERWEGEVD